MKEGPAVLILPLLDLVIVKRPGLGVDIDWDALARHQQAGYRR
jgi:L-alanine-DL-glutamate epimerase-like enolase superfamily enzyme